MQIPGYAHASSQKPFVSPQTNGEWNRHMPVDVSGIRYTIFLHNNSIVTYFRCVCSNFRGGFGVVHRCIHKQSQKVFAVKILNVAKISTKGVIYMYV